MNLSEAPDQFADVRKHLPFLARREGLARALEGVMGYPKIRKAFAESAEERNPFAAVARRLELAIEIAGAAGKIPRTGPVVFVSNHGHGGADALALMAMMCKFRADVRVLANREVGLLEGISPYLFPVSLLDGPSASENQASLRAMLKHVRKGGCLGVFPAGRVAFWQGDRMMDPPWNDHVVRLLQRMEATIVPVWFFGNPAPVINILSRLSPFVRTALIPTGLACMRGRTIAARIGEPVPSSLLKTSGEAAGTILRANLNSLREAGN